MPLKGRPAVKNNFANIGLNRGSSNNKRSKNNEVGDKLNKLAGVKTESRFVDQKNHNKMGKDGFLKLLSHQLQNQDPLKPMDQKSFAADLAQFAQLEQMTNINAKMTENNKGAPTQNKFYGASFLGKEILTKGTSINFERENEATDIPFHLPQFAKKVMIRFYDQGNQLVGQLDHEALGAGTHTLKWDGVGYNGFHVGKGSFRTEVRAWDQQLEEFPGETKSKGLITGVSFENGETVFTLKSGKKAFLRDVESFKMLEAQKAKALPKTNIIDQVKNTAPANAPALQKQGLKAYNNLEDYTL
jgi:flagellar basal-body rod modification protein FlgD